jgi:hypothetical protein
MGFRDVCNGFIHVKTTKCLIKYSLSHNYMAMFMPLWGHFYLMRNNTIDIHYSNEIQYDLRC